MIRSANTLTTAAATIPRGAKNAKKICSSRFKPDFHIAANTDNGRTIKIISTTNTIPRQPTSPNTVRSNREPSTINRQEIRNTPKFSLNSTTCSIEICFWLAK